MKNNGLLNPGLLAEIAALGHTEYLVIADCGLPIPKGVKTIDLSVVAGLPSLLSVYDAVAGDLVIESMIIADEARDKNPAFVAAMEARMDAGKIASVSHEDFKRLTANAKCVVRTGENSSYANVILIGGVNF